MLKECGEVVDIYALDLLMLLVFLYVEEIFKKKKNLIFNYLELGSVQ